MTHVRTTFRPVCALLLGLLAGCDEGKVPNSIPDGFFDMQQPGAGGSGQAGEPVGDGDGGGGGDGAGGMMSADAGTGGNGGGGNGGTGGTMEPARRPPCITKPSQVTVLGDSYISYNEQLNPDLAARAIADGALQEGEAWRLYALPGASLATGGILGFEIPTQFLNAKLADPDILATVMTGGGNDILIPGFGFLGMDAQGLPVGAVDCKNRADADQVTICKDIVALALDKAEQLMVDSADLGVADVVYFFYPNLPGGGLGGTHPNVILDYALPLAKELCDSAADTTGGRLHCHFIDLRPVFAGHPDWIDPADGIHPTAAGHEAMADEIWALMKDRCIAQPATSGCCEP